LAEWLIEQGIGEERAIRLDHGAIIAARTHWPGTLAAGQVEDAVLVSRTTGSARGTARFANGEEALVDRLPRNASEGARLRLKVTRAAIGEVGRAKLAQARPADEPLRPAPSLAEMLRQEGHDVRLVHRFPVDGPRDGPVDGWDELVADAFTMRMEFAGGALHLAPTPAMTLVDVDGTLPPRELALAAIPSIASAIALFDLAGSIGIDFPTFAARADRRGVDEMLAQVLAGWPHERTAMNGFGFVQLVSRLERPSLIHRIARSPAAAGARLLLRRAEAVVAPGRLLLTAHPAVVAAVPPPWRDELARRAGRPIAWAEDPALALEAGFAQAVQP